MSVGATSFVPMTGAGTDMADRALTQMRLDDLQWKMFCPSTRRSRPAYVCAVGKSGRIYKWTDSSGDHYNIWILGEPMYCGLEPLAAQAVLYHLLESAP